MKSLCVCVYLQKMRYVLYTFSETWFVLNCVFRGKCWQQSGWIYVGWFYIVNVFNYWKEVRVFVFLGMKWNISIEGEVRFVSLELSRKGFLSRIGERRKRSIVQGRQLRSGRRLVRVGIFYFQIFLVGERGLDKVFFLRKFVFQCCLFFGKY